MKCFWCKSKDFPMRPGVLWSGKKVVLCIDSAACIRRRNDV